MRLIDADRLKEVFRRNVVGGNSYFDLIDGQPTIEAVPVIHAKWIFEEADTDGIGNNQYKCSHCGHGDIHADDVVVNYCWFCGALMDGGKENELSMSCDFRA